MGQYRGDPKADGYTLSDGTPLTEDDVLATYLAAKESGYYAGRFNNVHSIELSEDGGVVFYLNTAYENLPQLLDVPILKVSEVAFATPTINSRQRRGMISEM